MGVYARRWQKGRGARTWRRQRVDMWWERRAVSSAAAHSKRSRRPRGKLLLVVRAHGGLYVYGPRLVETGKAGEQTGRDTNHHAAVGPGG